LNPTKQESFIDPDAMLLLASPPAINGSKDQHTSDYSADYTHSGMPMFVESARTFFLLDEVSADSFPVNGHADHLHETAIVVKDETSANGERSE
jgi:hypothetical protein